MPAKVDIVIMEDDSGSRNSIHEFVRAQLPAFLFNLQSQGWDFRFVSNRLVHRQPLNEIAVSFYDTNWYSLGYWLEPFPGADPTDSRLGVPSSLFTSPSGYSQFVADYASSGSSTGALEPGFENLYQFLHSSDSQSYFLRDDALLAVLNVSNGNDTSGVNFCTDYLTGYRAPCEQIHTRPSGVSCSSTQSYDAETGHCLTQTDYSSHIRYKNRLINMKGGDINKIRFYSAIATQSTSSCNGDSSRRGTRYITMSEAFNTPYYDICSTPFESILADMQSNLTETLGEYQTEYLVIGERPDFDTLQILKYPGGDQSQAIELSQSSSNGWSYEGEGCVNTVTAPISANEQCGVIFKLHGDAVLHGADSAQVFYRASGVRPSV